MRDEKFAGMREELLVEKLRGYRQWIIPASTPHLRSMGQPNKVWETTELTAECVHAEALAAMEPLLRAMRVTHNLSGTHEGPAPDPTCSCGIYGWYRPEDTDWHPACVSEPYVRVLGAIEIHGNVLMGTRGFRAQHARILGLWIPLQSSEYEYMCASYNYRFQNSRYTAIPNPSVMGGYEIRVDSSYESAPTYGRLREVTAERYPVPVHATLASLCEEFPPNDLSTLVPGLPMSMYHPSRIKAHQDEARNWIAYYNEAGRLSPDFIRQMFNL